MHKISLIEKFSIEQIEQLQKLYQQTWWANNRTPEETATILRNSISFGLFENETSKLIGYARVLTDEIRYAFIFDVIVDEKYHGQGWGKRLMQYIISHPKLSRIKYFELTCRPDMIEFYTKFGFSENYGPEITPMRFTVEK